MRSSISVSRMWRERQCALCAGSSEFILKPGESQKVQFDLKERDLSMVTEAGEPIIAEGTYSVSIGGGQPNTGAPTVAGTFQVKGTKTLPE